jgi:hypothetical protein
MNLDEFIRYETGDGVVHARNNDRDLASTEPEALFAARGGSQ